MDNGILSSVNICGITYKIEYVEDKFDMDLHFGQIEYGKGRILVNKDLAPDVMRQTIVHEMVHGMLLALGYNELTNDEQFVQAFSTAISQTFDIKGDSNLKKLDLSDIDKEKIREQLVLMRDTPLTISEK